MFWLKNILNNYHKIIIAFLYSTGLRFGELVNLKVGDLNLKEKYGIIRKGKGNKDRIFIISERLLGVVSQIITNNNLKQEDYLFINNRKNKYNVKTIYKITKDAQKKSGIKKNIHPHIMRHSFATYIIEPGESISGVQALLGHKSPETTMIYVHTAKVKMNNIKSPYDKY
ncbi:tyrosine-type recombinase/integrase [Candidatus Pacearchaeota archaeon]|nr:tyrosine-type recombinase/integrase [Candidatus Pacearchaeota archaeon]